MAVPAHQRQEQRSNRFLLLLCGCRSRNAVVSQVVLQRATPATTPTKVIRKTTTTTSASSPYDTVSSDDDDCIEIMVPLHDPSPTRLVTTKASPPPSQKLMLPTREIVPTAGTMQEISFLTIDPLLISVSTTNPSHHDDYDSDDADAQYHDRRDDNGNGDDDYEYHQYYDNNGDDDISDVTGFRDYSLISM